MHGIDPILIKFLAVVTMPIARPYTYTRVSMYLALM